MFRLCTFLEDAFALGLLGMWGAAPSDPQPYRRPYKCNDAKLLEKLEKFRLNKGIGKYDIESWSSPNEFFFEELKKT